MALNRVVVDFFIILILGNVPEILLPSSQEDKLENRPDGGRNMKGSRMGTESFQSLCTIVMMIGLLFTGVGGFGVYYFGQASQNQKDLSHAAKEAEFNANSSKLTALQKTNEELRQRLEFFELAAPMGTPGITKTKGEPGSTGQATERKASASGLAARPTPARVNAPPLASGGANAGTAEWSDSTPTLEQMAAAASSPPMHLAPGPQQSSRLSEKQRLDMARILRKFSGKSIAIHSVAGDSGGLEFAETLRRAFLDAGWRVGSVNQVAYAKPPVGLYVSTETFPSPQEVVATYQALTAAGLSVSQQLDSKLNGEKAVLLVGATAE